MSPIFQTKNIKKFTDISLAFEPNPINGDLSLLKDERAIQNSIKNIIMTTPKESGFDMDFGSTVTDLLFEFQDEGITEKLNLLYARDYSMRKDFSIVWKAWRKLDQ